MTTATLPKPVKISKNNGNGKKKEADKPKRVFNVSTGINRTTHKIGVYGQGGTGKTTMASMLKKIGINPLFIDLDRGSEDIDVDRIADIESWDELRGLLHNKELLADYQAIVIDTITRAEELAVEWTLANVPKTKNGKQFYVKNLKSYGWGDGDSFLFDTFLQLLGDLDVLAREKHVIVIAHACSEMVPNAGGTDYRSFMPSLHQARTGDLRSKFRDWVDHLFFLEIETFVSEDKKAYGEGTRILHPTALPHAWAKSRTLRESIIVEENNPTVWEQLLRKES